MTVSVIIPTHNRADLITEAIDSVLAQTYTDYEIIVVDDGSTDQTAEALGRYGDSVLYLYQSQMGPSAARNAGIKRAKGDLIAFLDSDDMWLPEKLSAQVAAMEANPSVGLVATGYATISAGEAKKDEQVLSGAEVSEVRSCHYKNYFATSTVMVRADCLKKVGRFDESLHFAEDWDLWLRILQAYDFTYIGRVLTRYRKHLLNITQTSFHRNVKDWEKVIERHRGRSFKEWLIHQKRFSWLYLNMAVVYRDENPRQGLKYLLKSIIEHPFTHPGRYSALVRLSIACMVS
ncbi:glycosyltransferase family 2 protein [Geomesophilobacter sediminis]|uniref:Glycosyltransferase n=1 Tax=Geomesophilobacter sediminis TaxID=2798584 RepID=A0A8J7M2H4_9BACT|nr:glycosyltransferase [Geomesophilobacter sediminis]MBJ6727098.1 glycosyltransferase [Geomesophilobacter sediminis]